VINIPEPEPSTIRGWLETVWDSSLWRPPYRDRVTVLGLVCKKITERVVVFRQEEEVVLLRRILEKRRTRKMIRAVDETEICHVTHVT